ncbi:MAG: enolase C-terminal domain-like protein [Myxococcota bacterium]
MKLEVRPYALAFPKPLQTASGPVPERVGHHLRLGAAIGEVVTWPGFGSDDPSRVTKELDHLATVDVPTLDSVAEIDAWLADTVQTPEVRAGVELLLLDRLALRQERTLASLLTPEPTDMVRLHQLVNDAADTPLHAHAIKMKVGSDIDAGWLRVSGVRERVGPETPIRLDANGSWTVPEAEEALGRFAEARVEFVEQPIAAGDVAAFAALRAASPVPLAADESIRSAESLEELLDADAIDVAVLKPAFAGGVLATQRLAERAMTNGVKVVITHALGSIVERSGALHLAAALKLRSACGLSHPFASERGCGYTVAGGIAHVPEAHGLGIDRSRLQ